MRRLADTLGHTLGEVTFLLGTVALLWLAAYLYELGYAARFGVPLAHVDVGFPRLLLVMLVLALATAGFAAAIMLVIERAYPFLLDLHRVATLRGATGLAVGIVAIALPLVPAEEPLAWLRDDPLGLDVNPLRLALIGGLLVHAAGLGARWRRMAQARAWPALTAASLALLLVALLPASMGWWEAGRRMETGRTFLALADRPDYRLVRLYSTRAVFAHWDATARRFDRGWHVERFDREESLLPRLTRAGGS